jgi:hypothetical protein
MMSVPVVQALHQNVAQVSFSFVYISPTETFDPTTATQRRRVFV